MKALLAFSFLLFLGMEAQAQQTADCGTSMAQVKDVIARKFADVMQPNYIERFIGDWVLPGSEDQTKDGKPIRVSISGGTSFRFNGHTFAICPQGDKSFYIYKTGFIGAENTGWIRSTKGGIRVYNGRAELQKVEGTFVRAKKGNQV
jgi:hypothetical protein